MSTPALTGSISALGDTVALGLTGQGGAGAQILGTWAGTLTFEVSLDGVTYQALTVTPSNSSTSVTTATANGVWQGATAGAKQFRVRASAWTSGTAQIHLQSADAGPSSAGTAIVDGGDVNAGATTDSAVTGDNTGTLSAKLRGINKILADVWSSANHWFTVSVANATLAVTQSGTWNVGVSSWTAAIYALVKQSGYENATWTQIHVPAANTQATATRSASGSASIKNVCTGFTVTLCSSSTTAPAAIQIVVNLIDGSTGGTTYLWRSVISLPATAGAITSFVRHDLWITGTGNTAMTLEFSAAAGANTIESVSMEGTTM